MALHCANLLAVRSHIFIHSEGCIKNIKLCKLTNKQLKKLHYASSFTSGYIQCVQATHCCLLMKNK